MGRIFYNTCKLGWRVAMNHCLREVMVNRAAADREGPFLLAVTHLSHLEPLMVGCRVRRQVRWMSRVEFYRPWWGSLMLRMGGAFPVDRYGWSYPAMRRAERLLREGEIVGIFPEGGVTQGQQSVMRGAPVRAGVCTLAIQTGVPIVPVVVLGTDRLNRVSPWLPFRRGRLWMAFGDDVLPPARGADTSRKRLRLALHDELVRAFGSTYRGLLTSGGLTDAHVP